MTRSCPSTNLIIASLSMRIDYRIISTLAQHRHRSRPCGSITARRPPLIDPPRLVSNSVAAAAGRASYLTEQIPLLGRLIPLLGAKIPLFGSVGDFQSGHNKINSLEGFCPPVQGLNGRFSPHFPVEQGIR